MTATAKPTRTPGRGSFTSPKPTAPIVVPPDLPYLLGAINHMVRAEPVSWGNTRVMWGDEDGSHLVLGWGTPFEEQKAAREWFDTRPDLQVVAFEEGSRPAFERKLNAVVGWCVQRRIYTECY